ncbi:BadF/BadG/BcrA/BcrD ATPase family protein [Rhizobium sp. BK251]|uniref:N-acetylglucosamine kinase n=1 Tax=Rhizobium sp. BK251 TaxID=2512125 RepID=UPI0010475A17|nr:BadF/BadG/BcrA/BcrD ATPase family protein [Rhizobium sp. BK251]TCL64082.1 N-acetylglucosamine kinase-like BadF-type ATPase [Rhizobium sp. BK251]
MSGELILGIDGGGSKVLVTLADRNGQILRTALGGGINPMDNPDWRHELERHIEPFRDEPGLAAIGAALPAYGEVAHLSALQKQCIDDAFPAIRRIVLNDVDAAHLGAFAGRPGVLILSGTGSMSWARNGAGVSARAGGWGDVIGDEGSSYWIGRAALNLISQSLDGRAKPTALAKAIYDHLRLDITDPINALGGWINGLARPRAGIAALAILVDRAADQGDETSIRLIEKAADELSKHYRAISSHCEAGTDWTYAGGTFSSRLLLEAVERRIGRRAVSPILPPIGGALLAAAQLLDWPLGERWFGQIAGASEDAIARSRQ